MIFMQFDVFEEEYQIMAEGMFAGLDVGGRILHRSDDGTHLTIATRYPNHMKGSYGATIAYHETFYVFAGTGRRTFPDGTVIEMKVGDVIYVEPGVQLEWEYDPGFADIAFFWSDKPLPAELTGGLPYPPNG